MELFGLIEMVLFIVPVFVAYVYVLAPRRTRVGLTGHTNLSVARTMRREQELTLRPRWAPDARGSCGNC